MYKIARIVCAMLLVLVVSACKEEKQQEQPTPTVNGEILKKEPVTLSMEFSGFIEASNTVQILPRVSGFIEERLFKEGEFVKEDQILFEIEKDTYKAAKDSAEGNLKVAQSSLEQAKKDYARAEKLMKNGDISKSTFDQNKAAYLAAQGNVQQTEAALKVAELDLGYATIRAPVPGKISDTNYERGNYITPAVGALTQIVVTDPVRVSIGISNSLIMAMRRTMGFDPQAKADDKVRARIRFDDGTYYERDGRIFFVDVLVDRITDSLKIKIEFENPDGILIPGQYVYVILENKAEVMGVKVPTSAVMTDQSGSYVLLAEEGKVLVRRIKTGQEMGTKVVVEEGLAGGETLLINGFQKVRPGAPVNVVLSENEEKAEPKG